MQNDLSLPTRRRFLRTTATAGAATLLLPQLGCQTPRTSASDRINVGFIGVGSMGGRHHLGRILKFEDVQVVGIAEVEATRREHAVQRVEKRYAEAKKSGQYRGCTGYSDFRELLARKDVDAVVIATPDHMHAIPCLYAAKAKKHIYCEKPLTHNIREGRLIVEAVDRHGVVFQTGSQQRSEFGNRFRRAVELVWNGGIGRVKTIRVGVGTPPVPCDLPTQPTPDDVDWDLWLGPAPWRGYNEILCPKGMHKHYPKFRHYREFAGGYLADMGAHHFDIAQWAMEKDNSGPTRIEPPEGDAVTGLRFVYSNGVEMFHGGKGGCTFEGSEGTIHVDRGVLESDPADSVKAPVGDKDRRVYPSSHHSRNWIDCIRQSKQTICPAEVGHRTATVCHLANIGYQLRRPLTWDPVNEQFMNDAEANRLVSREPRAPWSYDVG
jgi:predicted dehydrogenase